MLIHLLALLLTLNLFALHQAHLSNEKEAFTEPSTGIPIVPWFTGPIFSPTPINMLPGHPGLEPSFTFLATYGNYQDNWALKREETIWGINVFLDYQMGFTENFGLELQVQTMSSWQQSASSTRLMDTSILLGYQILDENTQTSMPNLRLDLQITFPTGPYKNLNPANNGLDAQGQGAYQFGPLLIAQKFFYLGGDHLLGIKGSASYLFPTPAYVNGFNTYGGSFSTHGKVHVGQTLLAFFNFEYSFTKQLAITVDLSYEYQKQSTFVGNLGIQPDNTPPSMGLPAKTQFTIAPQLEYSTSANTGIIAGAWFSPAGRNAPAFASLVLGIAHIF